MTEPSDPEEVEGALRKGQSSIAVRLHSNKELLSPLNSQKKSRIELVGKMFSGKKKDK